uniref:Ig-like domain-containing protein n=1 Tax=Stegastes partitus TaxID=144197 RepID=A0A3B4ZTJ7_9TELE
MLTGDQKNRCQCDFCVSFSTGEGGRMMDYNPDASDRRATLPGSYDPVVERELRALGSRPPGSHLDPANPARQALGGVPTEGAPPVRHLGVEPLIRASHANLARPVQGSEESVSVGSDYYGSMFSLYRGRTFSILLQLHQSSKFTPAFPLDPHPSRAQTADESQGFSSQVPLSSPQPPLSTHKNSISTQKQEPDKPKPSDPRTSKTDQTSNSLVMTPKLARAGPKIFDKVWAFEERRSSMDLPGRAAAFDSDDSIKKTGGPSKEEGQTQQGAAHRRAAFKQRASSLEDRTSYSQRVQSYQSKFAEELQRIKKLVGKPSLKKAYSTEQLSQKDRLNPGKLEPIPPLVVKKLEARERASQAAEKDTLDATSHKYSSSSRDQGTASRRGTEMDNGAERRSASPTGKKASPGTVREPGPQHPAKPPRRTPSPTPSISPFLKRRKAEAGRTSPALKMNIPAILVEDEPMETERVADKSKTRRSKKSKKGRSTQPRSPEEGASSDDSYRSADEEPAEGPSFEQPLQDTMAPSASEVTLKCIITGSPSPTVTWRKNGVEIRSDAFHVVRAEGQQHSLLIKEMRPNNAGSYCVTAVSAAGSASCSAVLYIHGKSAFALDASSPLQSDEEYLSPQEEAMEVSPAQKSQGSLNRTSGACTGDRVVCCVYKVAPCDQRVAEGQDVVLLARIRGQPKPMVSWLKDRVTVRTAGRFAVREIEDDTSEMRISSAKRSDAGLYVCKILSEHGAQQAECRVEVRGES